MKMGGYNLKDDDNQKIHLYYKPGSVHDER